MKTVCNELDKANQNFLWGHSQERNPIHLMSWEMVTKPKEMGGLVIKTMSQVNHALLAKIRWRIHQNDPALWARLVKDKYLCDYSILEAPRHKKPYHSSTW